MNKEDAALIDSCLLKLTEHNKRLLQLGRRLHYFLAELKVLDDPRVNELVEKYAWDVDQRSEDHAYYGGALSGGPCLICGELEKKHGRRKS
jgi:hypothetical protein